MSRSQWLPGHKKYGAITTVEAPAATQVSTAVAMEGSASSMWAASTLSSPRSRRHSATNSWWRRLASSRLDPWSTMTIPSALP